MKKLILKWNESYFKTFHETRLLSQLFCFSVAVILLILSADSVSHLIQNKNVVSSEMWEIIIKEILFILFASVLFGFRFLLLFSKRKILFWLSQSLWLAAYVALLSARSAPEFGGCTKNAFPMFGEFLSYAFIAYLMFSPLRQIITLLASFARIFIK